MEGELDFERAGGQRAEKGCKEKGFRRSWRANREGGMKKREGGDKIEYGEKGVMEQRRPGWTVLPRRANAETRRAAVKESKENARSCSVGRHRSRSLVKNEKTVGSEKHRGFPK